MEPGVLVRTIQTKKSFCQKPLSLGVIHRSQLSGSTVPTFAISGAYFDQGHGVSKHRMKRWSRNKGTSLSLWDAPCRLGVINAFYGICNLPDWTLHMVEQLWCSKNPQEADIRSNAGYKPSGKSPRSNFLGLITQDHPKMIWLSHSK